MCTIAQLCRAISSQLRHVSTKQSEKNLLRSNISPICPYNMVNFGPLAAEIVSLVWGTPANFNGFRVLAALLHSQTAALNRGRHLYSAGWPSRWALTHISSLNFILFVSKSSYSSNLTTSSVPYAPERPSRRRSAACSASERTVRAAGLRASTTRRRCACRAPTTSCTTPCRTRPRRRRRPSSARSPGCRTAGPGSATAPSRSTPGSAVHWPPPPPWLPPPQTPAGAYLSLHDHTSVITFRARHSRGEMHIGHDRLCVSVCLSLAAFPHYCTDPGVPWGNGRGCPL